MACWTFYYGPIFNYACVSLIYYVCVNRMIISIVYVINVPSEDKN